MSKCNKVKNPCKICLAAVTQKSGLKCEGACQSWVHYTCLNYTPGKIHDIKAGIIKVTCPCPDCKTTLPKEYRTDEPYSCNNKQCPAKREIKCENARCPVNSKFMKGGPNKKNQTSNNNSSHEITKCGQECKHNSSPISSGQPCPHTFNPYGPPRLPQTPHYDPCLSNIPSCPSGCSSSISFQGDTGDRKPMRSDLSAMEQMCNTVGQLTNQLNDLMTRMKEAVHDGGANQTCIQKGPRAMCPKPCFCPGNPGRKQT